MQDETEFKWTAIFLLLYILHICKIRQVSLNQLVFLVNLLDRKEHVAGILECIVQIILHISKETAC